MNKIYGHPGPWHFYVNRKDNVGLTIMEARQKYLKEQLMFESYFRTLNTTSTVSTAAAGAAGGSAPSTGGSGGGGEWDLEFTIDTNYTFTGDWVGVQTTQPALPSTAVCISNAITNPTDNQPPVYSDTPGGEITIDWGDGTVETLSEYNFEWNLSYYGVYPKPQSFRHDYATDGQYQIKIKGPGASTVKFWSVPLKSVEKIDFSTIELKGLFNAVPSSPYTVSLPNITFPSSKVIDYMFANATTFITDNFMVSNIKGIDVGGVDTWDISARTSLSTIFFGNTQLNIDISNWDVSSVTSLGAFNWYGSNGGVTGWQSWNLSSWTNGSFIFKWLSAPNATGVSGLNTTPHTSLWNGWSFGSNLTSGYNFYGMLSDMFIQDANVIRDWVIAIANDPNTPNDLVLDADALIASNFVYLAAAPDTGVTISSLNLTADSSFNAAVSTLQGKGWTVANF